MSLDTLANVKARLGITTGDDDDLIGQLQDSADAWVAGYCNRDFVGGTYTEYHAGAGASIQLRNYPVQSVTSVRVDPTYGFGAETALPTGCYVVELDYGVIRSLFGRFVPWLFCLGPMQLLVPPWNRLPRTVQVVYTTATGAVPADVRQAYAQLIGHWYRQVKTQVTTGFQDVSRQRFGDTLTVYDLAQLSGPPPADVYVLLGPYRTPLV